MSKDQEVTAREGKQEAPKLYKYRVLKGDHAVNDVIYSEGATFSVPDPAFHKREGFDVLIERVEPDVEKAVEPKKPKKPEGEGGEGKGGEGKGGEGKGGEGEGGEGEGGEGKSAQEPSKKRGRQKRAVDNALEV